MVKIEIDIPRPRSLLLWAVFLSVFILWWRWAHAPVTTAQLPAGGRPAAQELVASAEADVRAERVEQELLSHREEILRYQLSLIETEREMQPYNPVLEQTWQERRAEFMALINDKRASEDRLLAALRDIREAQEEAAGISARSGKTGARVSFDWPIEPALGISAGFHDTSYQKRFGIPHEGVDIPAPQGTIIRAPADGVVAAVRDRGLGFNSLTLSHDGGYATLYGHVSRFLVQEGEEVRAGDPIAESGGTPGTAGAGNLTTGAHLHMEFFLDGEHINPLEVLPSR